jgi:SAM-dependent methyltransferase
MNRQEHYRQEYARLKPGWRHSLHVFREVVERHLEPGARVLDIGCGRADFLAPVYAGKGARVVGCDPDLGALRLNRSVAQRATGLADDLPFADASFDAAVLVFVLEHLERPARAFAEIRRALRPGGRIAFLTPNAWNYNTWLIRLAPAWLRARLARGLHGRGECDTYPVRYRANTARRLQALLGGAGFRRVALILHGDPTYISINATTFALARGIERLLDLPALRGGRVHLIGVYEGYGQPN